MGYKKYFTLSFDDGLEQDKRLIKLLKKYDMKATFNISAGLYGQKNYVGYRKNMGWFETSEPHRDSHYKYVEHNRIPKDEVRQVYDGFEIASHAYEHEMLTKLSSEELERSITTDIKELSGWFGYEVVGHAYPYGITSDPVMQCLKRHGIQYARGVESSGKFHVSGDLLYYHPTCWFGERKTERLLDQFIEIRAEKEPLLFYMWGHSYEMDYGTKLCSWERIESILEKAAGKEDVVYCTNKEAFQYIKEEKQNLNVISDI